MYQFLGIDIAFLDGHVERAVIGGRVVQMAGECEGAGEPLVAGRVMAGFGRLEAARSGRLPAAYQEAIYPRMSATPMVAFTVSGVAGVESVSSICTQ